MRWDDVQVFLAIARTGTLSAAGRALGIDHSTVYRRLNQLEADLGVPLFHRDGGRYQLSEAGTQAVSEAEAAQTALRGFERKVCGYQDVARGVVKLTSPEALLAVLSPLLASFRAAWPALELQVAFSDRFLDLSRQEADVALRPTPRPPEDLVGRRIAPIAWSTYAPTTELDPGELPWAVYGDELADLAAARWWSEHHGREAVMLTVNSVPSMAAVVCAAGCRGLLPCFVGDADPRLHRLTDPIDAAQSALWLLVHPDLRRAARVRALLDHLWEGLQPAVPLLTGARAAQPSVGR